MRLALAIVLTLSALAALAQSRTDNFTPDAVEITAIALQPLPDAGCAARWCGEVASDDGGVTLRACTEVLELRNALNQARCAGLAVAGAPRVLRELRFPVDGGAP